MMLCIIFGIVLSIARRPKFTGKSLLFLFPILFLILVLGQLYTDDLKQGWTLVERNLGLLLLPFAIMGYQPLTKANKNRLMAFFTGAGLIAATLCLGIASYDSWQAGSMYVIPNDTHFIYNRFMHHRLTDPIGMHAVYFSLYLALYGLWLLQKILTDRRRYLWLRIAGLIYILMLLYLMKSAIIAFGFGLSVLVVLWWHYRNMLKSSPKKRLVFGGVGVAILLASSVAVYNKLEHFSLDYDIQNEQMSTLSIRMSLWECTAEVIANQTLLGTGTGDSQNELRKVFEEKGFTLGTKNDFNAHNMFLQYWMSNGIPALVVLILIFLFSFRKAWFNKDSLWLGFIILFFLFSLTESTLRTQKGLLFFILFTAVMVNQITGHENSSDT